jgi:GMP synthase-like glutamine amidotransferase
MKEILQPEDSVERFAQCKGIILSGSPSLSAFDEDNAYDMRIYDLPIPILGLCFGHQEIAKYYGGKVEHTEREYGPAVLQTQGKSPIFAALQREETVWMSHGDTVTVVPSGFDEIGISVTAVSRITMLQLLMIHCSDMDFSFIPKLMTPFMAERCFAIFVSIFVDASLTGQ